MKVIIDLYAISATVLKLSKKFNTWLSKLVLKSAKLDWTSALAATPLTYWAEMTTHIFMSPYIILLTIMAQSTNHSHFVP